MRVCIVGRGKVGRCLARELGRVGAPAVLVAARRLGRQIPVADLYLLTVPDARIRALAAQLAPLIPRTSSVLHTAGARGVDELSPLAECGVSVGVLHPLVSFASARAGSTLADVTFTTFGDAHATRLAKRLAKLLGARCEQLPAAPGPAYHAAAALVANGAAALAHAGVRILVELGFTQRAAEQALAGLLASVASNVRAVGVPAALTGPVVRGDVATVERHLAALAALDGGARQSYAALLPVIVESASAAGLGPKVARELRRLGPPRPASTRRSRR